MTEDPDTGESIQTPAKPASWLRVWIELTGAWALAVAWPLFQGASSGADAFTGMRAGPLDLILFVAATVLVAPTILTLIVVGVGLISPRLRRWLGAALLGALFSLVIWQVLRDHVGPDGLELVLYLAIAAFIAWAYLRFRFAETMITLLSMAAPVTVFAFLFTGPGHSLFFGDSTPEAAGAGQQRAPVVMLVLDEFPLAALESRPGVIDAKRFPNFARLAKLSSWYANARSVGDATIQAVPAVLSGKRAESLDTPPASGEYPKNLFTLLHAAGYQVDADESSTDLCPHDICPRQSRTRARLAEIAVNGLWIGRPLPDAIDAPILRKLGPVANELNVSQRTLADRFIAEGGRGPDTLHYQHLLLPHIPWMYLPDGTTYTAPAYPGLEPAENGSFWAGPPELTAATFQRFMLQLEYVDSVLGRLIQSMRADGSWQKALFVVVADHGASYENGQVRREVSEHNAGWILPVPLFIKRPGQTRGRVIKRTVHTNQTLPTMLDILGVPTPEGLPPTLRSPAATKDTKVLSTAGGEVDLSAVQLHRLFSRAVRYRNEIFASPSLYDLTGNLDLIGTRPDDQPSLDPIDAEFNPFYGNTRADPSSGYLPAYVTGTFPGGPECPKLAIALNGRVGLTIKSFPAEGECEFAGVVDPSLFREGENDLRAFRIKTTKAG
ncbi:MAG: sulfatase-like hydrolase/transferase [Solirubrobacterales bacterium]|nr:sulfatase-like hydrolase/transferase [Solirubrobacterales bacterium]OJU95960.1 MAG: hypothetical protein BGO23_10360 [Solirubrobacterales bacterium 67-14]